MEIKIRTAQGTAQDIEIGDLITLSELRLAAKDVEITPEPGGPVRIGEATATAVITEATLNRILARHPPEGLRDLEIKTLSGRIGIEGKKLFTGIPIPFTLLAVPEIEGGARLRLNVQQVHVLGPIPLPHVAVQGIANLLNDTLARNFDATRLPIPIRLTKLTVETGRLLLSGTASVEIRPRVTAGGQEIRQPAD